MTKRKPILILMAEDDPDDRLLIRAAFKQLRLPNELRHVPDGEELMDYLEQRGAYADPRTSPSPGLILLDLNMPRKDGREALQEIRENPRLRGIPIVVLTTSKAEEDILASYDMGANSFIRKPVSFERLVQVVESVGQYWLETVELPPEVEGI